jgi:hypothetical protein
LVSKAINWCFSHQSVPGSFSILRNIIFLRQIFWFAMAKSILRSFIE